MGILRSDRVSGLGGANAINGSVFFAHDGDTGAGESGALQVQNENDALTFGTGDFTIEFWFYANRVGAQQQLYDGRGTGAGSNTAVLLFLSSSNKVVFFTTNANRITGSTTIAVNTWYHVALTRTGSTHTLYVNGSSDGTWSVDNLTYTGPTNTLSNIGSDDNGAGAYGLNGYISNVRVAKELIYSAAFTVPTTRLFATTNTTLICCQSPGNVLASYGGLNLNTYASDVNSKAPSASRFVPDKGEDHGTTLGDNTKFDTLSYMVPPGGTTTESNRGRAVFAGGYSTSPDNYRTTIDYVQIQSLGNAVLFGNLSALGLAEGSACASSTRAIQGGGGPSGSVSNIMEYVTIATTSNTTDFGDLVVARRSLTALANNTRGIWAGGTTPAMREEIDYATIATVGNATDFGNLTDPRRNPAVGSITSTTRGIFAGGNPGSGPQLSDTIDYITIATTGNATDFGNQATAMREQAGASSSVRGLMAGGFTSPANLNRIEYITIATTGNGTDFGDLNITVSGPSGTSNGTRALFAGGSNPYINSMEYATIATLGNAKDFGDLTQARLLYSGTSDSHGGIS